MKMEEAPPASGDDGATATSAAAHRGMQLHRRGSRKERVLGLGM